MDILAATRALGALSQPSRLSAFRLLVEEQDDGMPAGAIAARLGVPHNTLSTHLAILSNAGLVVSARQGRSIIYRADIATLKRLLSFLIEDCCHGQPEKCETLLDDLLPGNRETA